MIKPPRIAVLGTGVMGYQVARRLAGAGFDVAAWNRTRDRAVPLIEEGVMVVEAPSQAARGRDIAICLVSSGPVADDVLFGTDSAGATPATELAPGGTLVVMSSIPVETARAQAARAEAEGLRYVDAPASGGESGARDGTLAIMAGGTAEAVDGVADVLSALGRLTRVGEAGAGALAKLCNQMIVGTAIAAVGEALLLARRAGVDPAAVREAMQGGFADSPVLREHGRRMLEHDWHPGGAARLQLKDLHTAAALAETLGLDLPVMRTVEALFAALVAHGDAEHDHSALILELERRNGLG
jgi:3-hydroxyisobutyrate dehydrogenase-like beta-hydroxyacid dehydrogenase